MNPADAVVVLLFLLLALSVVAAMATLTVDLLIWARRTKFRRRAMAFKVQHPPHRDRNLYSIADWRRKQALRGYKASVRTYR